MEATGKLWTTQPSFAFLQKQCTRNYTMESQGHINPFCNLETTHDHMAHIDDMTIEELRNALRVERELAETTIRTLTRERDEAIAREETVRTELTRERDDAIAMAGTVRTEMMEIKTALQTLYDRYTFNSLSISCRAQHKWLFVS